MLDQENVSRNKVSHEKRITKDIMVILSIVQGISLDWMLSMVQKKNPHPPFFFLKFRARKIFARGNT